MRRPRNTCSATLLLERGYLNAGCWSMLSHQPHRGSLVITAFSISCEDKRLYWRWHNKTSRNETIQGLVMASCPANGWLVDSTDDKSTLPQSQQLGVSTVAVIYIAMVIRQYFRRYIPNPYNTTHLTSQERCSDILWSAAFLQTSSVSTASQSS